MIRRISGIGIILAMLAAFVIYVQYLSGFGYTFIIGLMIIIMAGVVLGNWLFIKALHMILDDPRDTRKAK